MHVAGALLPERVNVLRLPPLRRIVVAKEHARVGRQLVEAVNRAIELPGVAAGEVGARGAEVGREQRVADEHGVADDVADAVARVARRAQHAPLELADRERLPVGEQVVELRAVRVEIGEVEHFLERRLNAADALPDGDTAAEPLLEIGRGRQMIGVSMGLEDPVDREPLRLDERGDRVGRGRARAPGLVVVVEDGINDGGGGGTPVADHVRKRARGLVIELFDLNVHLRLSAVRR